MRKFLALQWILLIIGIGVLIFCEVDCEIPQGFLDKLKLRLQINVQKIHVKSHYITLSNFNYKNFLIYYYQQFYYSKFFISNYTNHINS